MKPPRLGEPGWVLPLGVFALVVSGAAPSVDWLDSGNLVGSAWLMGVAHPPGESTWLVFARLAQLVPVGDIAFRTTLLSSAALALCAVPLLWAARSWELGGTGSLAAGMVVAASLVGLGGRLQGGRPEVYALVALLLAFALAAALRCGGLRGAALVGLAVGLAAGVHPLLAAAACPALLALLCPGRPRPLEPALAAVFGGLVGLGSFLWLPLRARAVPAHSWGVPDNLTSFFDVVLARTFGRNFGGEEASVWDNLWVVGSVWAESGVVMLGVLGLAAAWKLGSGGVRRNLLVASALWLGGNAMTVVPQNKVFASNPDVWGYLLVGALGLVPLAAAGAARLGWIGLAAASLALALQLTSGLSADRSDNHLARRFAVAQSAGLPTGSIAMTSGNDTAFLWSYLQKVERRRVDIVWVHRVLLGHAHELRRLGGLEGLNALGLPWDEELQREPLARVAQLRRPFFLEVREPELASVRSGRLHQFGLLATDPDLAPPRLAGEARETTLAELSQPRWLEDTEARLVHANFVSLWGQSR